ncbi:MAG: NYN domain-containing protein [Sphingobacteriia bacterium]|nr:NYN domain-containing protein [Sphingobacteriia bacterium]
MTNIPQPNRTIWIIDAGYLIKAAPGKFDYLSLKRELEQLNGEPFLDTYYLNSTYNLRTDQQDAFITWLKSAPPKGPKMRVILYELREVHLRCTGCGAEYDKQLQKGVDVGLATLMIKLAYKNLCDRIILSAGDGDFQEAIDFLQSELRKEVWVTGFENSLSADLQSYADRVIWLEDLWPAIKKTGNGNRPDDI